MATKKLLDEDDELGSYSACYDHTLLYCNLSALLMHTNAHYRTLLLSVPGPRDQRFKVKGLDNLRKASLSRLILSQLPSCPRSPRINTNIFRSLATNMATRQHLHFPGFGRSSKPYDRVFLPEGLESPSGYGEGLPAPQATSTLSLLHQ